MSNYNAMEMKFDEVILFDKPALFTNLRIDRNTVPKGYEAYDIRHNDYPGDAVQIARGILVNHMGTVITREKVKLSPNGFRAMNPEDLNFAGGECESMKSFMETYPPKIKPPKQHER